MAPRDTVDGRCRCRLACGRQDWTQGFFRIPILLPQSQWIEAFVLGRGRWIQERSGYQDWMDSGGRNGSDGTVLHLRWLDTKQKDMRKLPVSSELQQEGRATVMIKVEERAVRRRSVRMERQLDWEAEQHNLVQFTCLTNRRCFIFEDSIRWSHVSAYP
jgi:hypothetical protein